MSSIFMDDDDIERELEDEHYIKFKLLLIDIYRDWCNNSSTSYEEFKFVITRIINNWIQMPL